MLVSRPLLGDHDNPLLLDPLLFSQINVDKPATILKANELDHLPSGVNMKGSPALKHTIGLSNVNHFTNGITHGI